MLRNKSLTGFVFSLTLLLSAVFYLQAFAGSPEADSSEARRISVDVLAGQGVALEQSIDKAVPPAVPVRTDSAETSTAEAKPPVVLMRADSMASAEGTASPAAQQKIQIAAQIPGETILAEPAKPSQPKPAQTASSPSPAKPAQASAAEPQVVDEASKGAAKDERSPAAFIKAGDTTLLPKEAAAVAVIPSTPSPVSGTEDVMKVKPDSSDHFSSIERNIGYYSSSIKKHFTLWLTRSGKYVDIMKGILRENYLPEDLVFLALIESGFNTKAYSVARASGPWQFIRGTAKRYGLRIDRWVDERRDPIKSTKAAAAYLRDLYKMFGSWPLAMASYNCGEGNIARAVRRNDTEDFWELRKTRSIPRETKEYVPKFVAAQMIASNPENYGFEQLEYERPFEYDEVNLTQCTSLATVAKCCGVPESEIKELNPELLRGCTPPNQPEYALRIPKGMKDNFLQTYAALPDEEKVAKPPKEPSFRRYVVRRGDTMKSIARRFDVSPSTLASANRMRASARLRRGQRLRIPVDDGISVVASNASRENKKKTDAETAEPDEKNSAVEELGPSKASAAKTYKVRRGDTLAGIARRHGISVALLAKLNSLGVKSRVRAGQILALSKPLIKQKLANTDSQSSKKAVSSSDKDSGRKYASKKTYRVRRGDTLYSIARKFRISKERLATVNSISGTSLRQGQRLVIPDEKEA